jgi:ABC-type uncharacterized transport system permease subunit
MYWLLAFLWGGSCLFFLIVSALLGRSVHSATDGCLLGFGNTVCVFLGGLFGYALVRYPMNILVSGTGALFLPAGLTAFWMRHTVKRKQS